MKKLTVAGIWVIMLFSVIIFPGCETYRYGTQGPQIIVDNPPWAPPYYTGARYYYFPDIECYYDIYTREFIYLDHAQWIYSPNIPYMYRDFDLNNCFVVIVNSNIYQPWMHHQYYLSHFPRYYYRDYYDHSNFPYVRGYNENSRSAIFWGDNDRGRARRWDNDNLRNNRQFKYSKEDRRQQNRFYDQSDQRPSPDIRRENVNPGGYNRGNNPNSPGDQRNIPATRPPQQENNQVTQPSRTDNDPRQQPAATPETQKTDHTNYYGRPIGQPVKVERRMRDQRENGQREENQSPGSKRRSNSGRR